MCKHTDSETTQETANKTRHATADALGSGRLLQVWAVVVQAGRRVPAVRELDR
jgi:hypothetical protein